MRLSNEERERGARNDASGQFVCVVQLASHAELANVWSYTYFVVCCLIDLMPAANRRSKTFENFLQISRGEGQ
jgi:NADH:ubiquinone oxidoreductase subunit B-like Fe-S oxidoreductase